MDGMDLIPDWARFFLSLQCPDWFWGSLNLLFDGYNEPFSQELISQGIKLTTHHFQKTVLVKNTLG
jgi:hypothetical protein